jgi:Fe-S cluster assembly protein SufD
MNMVLTKTTAEEALGMNLPSRRDEDWKWTDLKRLIDWRYAPTTEGPHPEDVKGILDRSPFAKIAKARLVFVNGRYDNKNSKTKGLDFDLLPHGRIERGVLADINAAIKPQGVALRFGDQTQDTVEIIHVVTPGVTSAIALHNTIEVKDGCCASVIETFVGFGGPLVSSLTEITLGKSARLDRVKYQNEDVAGTHLSDVTYSLEENAKLNDFTAIFGANLTRQNGTCVFNGQNAEAKISGSYLLKGKQHADTRLVIDHKVPNCMSRELFKCVMDNDARGIFQGKVIVRPDAQKTDGKQSSHALLLSETAEFDAKPELEIYADDVVCGHGTTCGDLNHDYLFYLMSRGITKAQARAMLVEAFVAEAIETVENEAVRDVLLALVHERMA